MCIKTRLKREILRQSYTQTVYFDGRIVPHTSCLRVYDVTLLLLYTVDLQHGGGNYYNIRKYVIVTPCILKIVSFSWLL